MHRIAISLAILLFLTTCSSGPDRPPASGTSATGLFGVLAPVDRGTGERLAALKQAGDFCRAVLDVAQVSYTPVADIRKGPFCGFSQAVEITGSAIPYTRPTKVTCPVAVGLYLWQRDVVIPAARRHFNQRVSDINHYGSYSCRMRNSRAGRVPSEHATGNAIDIAGFRLADGRNVTVLDGWHGDADERAFLREVRDGACRIFRLTLSPDSDAAHKNHFHFDMGRWNLCE